MNRFLVIAVCLAAPMVAHPQGNAVEAIDNARDLRKDHRDRAQIVFIAADWTAAVDAKSKAGEQAADLRLTGWLIDELHEANVEVREARREKNASARERNRSRKAKDVQGLRDDRRDHRDDKRDTLDAHIDRAKLHKVVTELKTMQPRFEAGTASNADERKRVLLATLVQSANAEIRDERREIREDRRERREDRR